MALLPQDTHSRANADRLLAEWLGKMPDICWSSGMHMDLPCGSPPLINTLSTNFAIDCQEHRSLPTMDEANEEKLSEEKYWTMLDQPRISTILWNNKRDDELKYEHLLQVGIDPTLARQMLLRDKDRKIWRGDFPEYDPLVAAQQMKTNSPWFEYIRLIAHRKREETKGESVHWQISESEPFYLMDTYGAKCRYSILFRFYNLEDLCVELCGGQVGGVVFLLRG